MKKAEWKACAKTLVPNAVGNPVTAGCFRKQESTDPRADRPRVAGKSRLRDLRRFAARSLGRLASSLAAGGKE